MHTKLALHTIERVTNISELFQVLAIDWEDKSKRRKLIAGNWGGQFVRVYDESNSRPYPFYNMQKADIPVESASYSMRGFIKFESDHLFRGLFDRYQDDQDVYLSAELTKEGFAFANLNVADFKNESSRLPHIPFFNPALKNVVNDIAINYDEIKKVTQ